MSKFLRVLVFLGAVLVATFSVIVLLDRAPRSPVAEWKQPSGVDYHASGPYFLSVLRDDLDWSGFPFYVSRNHSIYVGRESGTPNYGHVVKFSFHPDTESNYDVELSVASQSAPLCGHF